MAEENIPETDPWSKDIPDRIACFAHAYDQGMRIDRTWVPCTKDQYTHHPRVYVLAASADRLAEALNVAEGAIALELEKSSAAFTNREWTAILTAVRDALADYGATE